MITLNGQRIILPGKLPVRTVNAMITPDTHTDDKGNITKSYNSIQYAFPTYGDKRHTFKLKGKDVKSKMVMKKARLQSEIMALKEKMPILMTVIKEKGFIPAETDGDENPVFSYDQIRPRKEYMGAKPDDKTSQMMSKYNDTFYQCRRRKEDIEIIDVMLQYFDDSKSYDMDINQIVALEKAEVLPDLGGYPQLDTFMKTGQLPDGPIQPEEAPKSDPGYDPNTIRKSIDNLIFGTF